MKRNLLVLLAFFVAAVQKSSAQSCLTETSMTDFAAGVPANIDISTSPGDIRLKTVFPDQQNTSLGTSGVGITTTTYGGQTFTPAMNGKLVTASVNLFCSGCTGATPNLVVQVRATSGNLPTSILASTTITGFNLGSSAYYDAVFATPADLTAGTTYAIVVYPSANPSPGTYALTRSGTSTAGADVYSGGTRVAGATSGTVWSIPLTGGVTTDAGFATYMTSVAPVTGTLTSQVKDAGALVNGATFSFNAATPVNTALKFQVAASTNVAGPFNFVGPDNTASTYYSASGASLANFSNQRYFQYKAFLSNTDGTSTPTLNDVTLCFTASTLPVRWLGVSGTRNSQSQAVIDWTVQETNVASYEVQKSGDGREFSTVAILPSKGEDVQAYRFTDTDPLHSIVYFRIRQTDNNGKASYSSVIKLENTNEGRLQVGPNPASNVTTLTVSSDYLNKKAELVDAGGRRVVSFRINKLTTTLDLSSLPRGIYLLRIEDGPFLKISRQ